MSLNKRLFTGGALPGATLENAFSAFIYNGNNSSQSLTGLGFQPDLLWIKQRGGDNPHLLMDSTRGAGKLLTPNTTAAESGNSGDFVGSFDSDGFQVNRNYLQYTAHDTTNYGIGDAAKYVAWAWRANGGTTATNSDGSFNVTVQANTAAGFSIITYTGQGSDATYGHGLDSAPDFLFTKTRSHTSDWPVYHKDLTSAAYRLVLNSNNAENTDNNPWNSTAPTSSVISIKGDAGNVNTSGRTYVTYAFHSIPGFSQFGSYTGNGSTTGPTITLGFTPGLLILRNLAGDRWIMADNKRDTSNPNDKFLDAQDNHEESTLGLTGGVDFLSNGFQIKTSDGGANTNDQEYIYMAWREAS